MYFDFKVKIPEVRAKIFQKTIKSVTYINYEYDRVYKPEKNTIFPSVQPLENAVTMFLE